MALQTRELNIELKRSIQQDEAQFTRRMFEQARQDGPSQLQSLLRAVLKTGRRYRAPQLSPSLQVGEGIIVEQHFAHVQRATCLIPSAESVDDVEIEGAPTVARVASAFAAMKGLASSYLHTPIFLKILARQRAPLLWRGA